ncbi:MAG: hypothetical protein R3C19_00435 [Planctomycetaceae bacterium]
MNHYQQPRIEPPLSEWSDLLAARNRFAPGESLSGLRIAARRRLVDSAEQFVLRLNGIAQQAGLPEIACPVLTGDPTQQPLVMTGHQPVIFHSGLTFKYETAERFAADQNAIAVAVVIDTDEGDVGRFEYPEPADATTAGTANTHVPPLHVVSGSLSQPSGTMAAAALKPSSEIPAIADKVRAALASVDRRTSGDFAHGVLQNYARLSEASAAALESNLIMRWRHGIGGRMLELPLSAIAAFPETLELTAGIIQDARNFADGYNRALGDFRTRHNISNAANPFPNLTITDSVCELPFWVLDHTRQTRRVLQISGSGGTTTLLADGELTETTTGGITSQALESLLLRNVQIAPRGALITAFLRLLFSDLFVHGTGGARYDRFTDEFIRLWWKVEPTAFVMASASRYLFAEQRTALEKQDLLAGSLRDLQHNPQRSFGTGVFSQSVETELQSLVRQKQSAVEQMRNAHADGRSAREIGREIQRLSDRIKAAVTDYFEPQLAGLAQVTQFHRDAVNGRTYPWFFFPPDSGNPRH